MAKGKNYAQGGATGPAATGGRKPSKSVAQATPNVTSSPARQRKTGLLPVSTTGTAPTKGVSVAASRALANLKGSGKRR